MPFKLTKNLKTLQPRLISIAFSWLKNPKASQLSNPVRFPLLFLLLKPSFNSVQNSSLKISPHINLRSKSDAYGLVHLVQNPTLALQSKSINL